MCVTKTLLVLHRSEAMKTLRLQLIHHFAVKSRQRSVSKYGPFVAQNPGQVE